MSTPYPDRRAELFGREPALHAICDRAREPGVTVVSARPLMGKTWTLIEAARRLEEEGTFIVGYHESRGSENSHLLYAVSNLYTRWLDDSSLWDQARDLWEQKRHGLIPRIGSAVGAIFEKLGGTLLPDGVGSLVQKSFEGLAGLQDNLLNGGQTRAPLPYDEAKQLADLVVQLGGKRVVLILDAWEKTPTLAKEFATLEGIAKAPEDWPRAHLIVAVRNPDTEGLRLDNEAWQRAKDLVAISGGGGIVELDRLDADDAKETARLLAFVRASIPAAQPVPDATLLDMIDGYPGVLNFWLGPAVRKTLHGADDLLAKARDAQSLRYRELTPLLAGLKEPEMALVGMLTVLPRLDATSWDNLAPLLLDDGYEATFDALVDRKILLDKPFPTFGHDTRYVAARRCFLELQDTLLKRLARRVIDRLAAGIDGLDGRNHAYVDALVGCSDAAQALTLEPDVRCLVAAARSLFGDPAGMFDADFQRDGRAALKRQPNATALVAFALVNRAIENGRRGDRAAQIADYDGVLALAGAPAGERLKALSNRAIARAEGGDTTGALADLDAALALPGIAPADVARVLVNRGLTWQQAQHDENAVADFTRVVEIREADVQSVVMALIDRAKSRSQLGDGQGAMDDLRFAASMPAATPDQVSQAMVNRSAVAFLHGDPRAAVADATSLIDWPPASRQHVVGAYLNRGMAKKQLGDAPGARADYDAMLRDPAASPDARVKAYVNRGLAWQASANPQAAASDFASATAVPDANAILLAMARQYVAGLAPQPG